MSRLSSIDCHLMNYWFNCLAYANAYCKSYEQIMTRFKCIHVSFFNVLWIQMSLRSYCTQWCCMQTHNLCYRQETYSFSCHSYIIALLRFMIQCCINCNQLASNEIVLNTHTTQTTIQCGVYASAPCTVHRHFKRICAKIIFIWLVRSSN